MDVREKLAELLTEFYGCDPMYYDVDALAMVGKRVCVRYHQAIPMGDKIAGPGSYPLDAFAPTAERRMIMDEVKYYPARMDYPNLCKPYSNADRVRSMSDDELIEFIKNIKVRAALCKAVKNNDAFEKLCSAEWLKQPCGGG